MTEGDGAADAQAEEKTFSVHPKDDCSHVNVCKPGTRAGPGGQVPVVTLSSRLLALLSPWPSVGAAKERKGRRAGKGEEEIQAFPPWLRQILLYPAWTSSYTSCKAP